MLKRSIVTSTITLLPIVALFIFGGATLQDFAFAIMVGIAVGAVSTIFIATPILSSLLEGDKEYAGRRGEASTRRCAPRRSTSAEVAAADAPHEETPFEQLEDGVGVGGSPESGGEARTPAPAAPRGRMDDPGNDVFDERDPLDRLLSLLGPKLDELRALFDEASSRWRGDALRVGEGTRQRMNAVSTSSG